MPIDRRLARASLLACCSFYAGLLGLAFPPDVAAQTTKFDDAREKLIREDLIGGGIKSERVLEAIRKTPRHEFVPINQRDYAYLDMALPIGEQQTISPPFVVAYMTEQLDPQTSDRVLEIGTGSGYQAAVLSPLVKEVYSIEIVEELGRKAERTLKKLKYSNVYTRVGDGYKGWPEKAPFDKIIVTCSPEEVPVPLVEQLREGGRMIIPLGERFQQTMYLLKKEDGKLIREGLRPTLFVQMTGKAEAERQVQPDPLRPALVNGSFEETRGTEAQLDGWHYLRQGKVIEDPKAPDGTKIITFQNDTPGRMSNTVQGFAVDGRKVPKLFVACTVRCNNVRPGRKPQELPTVHVTYYDDDRAMVGEDWVGPWFGTFEWSRKQSFFNVPIKARSAIIQIGLLGGTGEASFDKVEVSAAEGK